MWCRVEAVEPCYLGHASDADAKVEGEYAAGDDVTVPAGVASSAGMAGMAAMLVGAAAMAIGQSAPRPYLTTKEPQFSMPRPSFDFGMGPHSSQLLCLVLKR